MSASQQYAHPPSMSLGLPDQNSQRLSVNLGSNNPFRNRASSATPIPRPERPTSTNPFLDNSDALSPQSAPDMTANTRDLFESLNISPTSPTSSAHRPAPPRPDNAFQKLPPNNRAPSAPRDRPARGTKDPLDIFADPPSLSKTTSRTGATREERKERKPRRNSESSIMERPKILDAEDEKRRRERRRREREGRSGDGKSRSKKPHYQLDIIDKLDVTSIYGTGMFHHDGPFDACNPHRNRKGLRTAPMQAFPKDSANMALGGAGPNNKGINLDLFHGTGEQGYNDFAVSGRETNRNPINFDPTARVEPVHGSESMGLGTSTFLEGAPASRAAMQRRASENENQMGQNGGLQRKKSLAQRIRGMNRPQTARMVSPDSNSPASPTNPSSLRSNDKNPFFQQDYDDAWDKKGARINHAEESRSGPEGGRARSSSSPKQSIGLERKFTNERSNTGLEDGKTGGGGFLNRMKSLRRPQPKRRVSND